MFLNNGWYVAAWDDEVGHEPLARTLLGQPVVLFRTEDGTPVALEDRCCHRSLPLSMGRITGDAIECGYHGLAFDRAGACVRVPGQTAIPPDAAVRFYPLVERRKWLWIWMGDPALADAGLIPDWWWMDHPDWKMIRGYGGRPLPVKCDYQLITDNLVDLSHLTYVHSDTIGNDEIIRFPAKTEREANLVRMTRLMPDVEPPPFYRMAGGFAGNVDRWQIVEASLPCGVDVDVGCAEIGSGVLDGDRPQGTAFHVLCAPTPETATTSHLFYAHPRIFRVDDAAMDEIFRNDFTRVFHEDVAVLEAQQASIDHSPDGETIDINVDAPAIAVRSMLRRRIAEEKALSGEAT